VQKLAASGSLPINIIFTLEGNLQLLFTPQGAKAPGLDAIVLQIVSEDPVIANLGTGAKPISRWIHPQVLEILYRNPEDVNLLWMTYIENGLNAVTNWAGLVKFGNGSCDFKNGTFNIRWTGPYLPFMDDLIKVFSVGAASVILGADLRDPTISDILKTTVFGDEHRVQVQWDTGCPEPYPFTAGTVCKSGRWFSTDSSLGDPSGVHGPDLVASQRRHEGSFQSSSFLYIDNTFETTSNLKLKSNTLLMTNDAGLLVGQNLAIEPSSVLTMEKGSILKVGECTDLGGELILTGVSSADLKKGVPFAQTSCVNSKFEVIKAPGSGVECIDTGLNAGTLFAFECIRMESPLTSTGAGAPVTEEAQSETNTGLIIGLAVSLPIVAVVVIGIIVYHIMVAAKLAESA